MSELYLIAAGLAVALIVLLVIGHYRGEIAKLRTAIEFHKMRADAYWRELNDMLSRVLVFQAAEDKRREQRLAASAKAALTAKARAAARRAKAAAEAPARIEKTFAALAGSPPRPRDEVVAGVLAKRSIKNSGAGVVASKTG